MKNILIIVSVIMSYGLSAQLFYKANEVNLTSSALGTEHISTGLYSFATGKKCSALGKYSTAIGLESEANGHFSTAIGTFSTTATGTGSIALGSRVNANASYSYVWGLGLEGKPLENGISNSLMIGFMSDIPTLTVRQATGQGTVGKVGIGTTDPETMLDVAGTFNVDEAVTFGDNLQVDGILMVDDVSTFTNDLTVTTKIISPQIQITQEAGINKVLSSDANGNASWEEKTWKPYQTDIYFDSGSVGIGTNEPYGKLDVLGKTRTSTLQITQDAGENKVLSSDASGNASWIDPLSMIVDDGDWAIDGNDIYRMIGNVGIGTTNPSEALTVNGVVKCKKVHVTENVPSSDFVFEDDYALMPIADLESFVSKEKHLPEIPSAKDFKKNGYDLNTMDDLLLRKVEQLVLYTIEAKKEREFMQSRIEALEKENQELKKEGRVSK